MASAISRVESDVEVWFPPKLRFLFKPSRNKVAYGGRGSSKSWSIARALLLIGKQPDLLWPGWSKQFGNEGIRILCYRETMTSIEQSVHQLLSNQIRLLHLEDFYDVQLKNIVGANGTTFFFAGVRQSADNLKSYERVHIAWGSQAEAMSKRSLAIVFPTLRVDIPVGDKTYGSELWFDFNPEFETDEIFKTFANSQPPDDSQIAFINWYDNPFFPEVLRKQKDDLMRRDPDEAEHVYGGTCRTAVEGAIYKNELLAAEKEGRLTGRVPWDPTRPVSTFWDIGPAHTRIWFAQAFPFEYRIIDYVAGEIEALAHYVKEIKDRPYAYEAHNLPHDAQAKELGTGKSIQEQLKAASIGNIKIVPKLSVADGIAAVRAILPRCWFDSDKCRVALSDGHEVGIRGLRCYQYEYDQELRTFKKNPLHDWSSHDADAFRYLAVAIKDQKPAREVHKSTVPTAYYPSSSQGTSWMR